MHGCGPVHGMHCSRAGIYSSLLSVWDLTAVKFAHTAQRLPSQGVQAAPCTRLTGGLRCCPDEAEVTHIVFPFGAQGDPDDGKQYMRNLGRRYIPISLMQQHDVRSVAPCISAAVGRVQDVA